MIFSNFDEDIRIRASRSLMVYRNPSAFRSLFERDSDSSGLHDAVVADYVLTEFSHKDSYSIALLDSSRDECNKQGCRRDY